LRARDRHDDGKPGARDRIVTVVVRGGDSLAGAIRQPDAIA